MLTLENVKQFQKELEQLNALCKDMIRVRTEQKMFKNSDDYYNSLKTCQWFPQDYYKIRLFDSELYLKFNNRTKCFYAHFETIQKVEFLYRFDVTDFCKSHDIKLMSEHNRFIFSKEKDFKEVVREFMYLIKLYIEYLLTQDTLFNFYEL